MQSQRSKERNVFEVPEGMPRSVWENKYARKTETGFQTWSERVTEVVEGNFLLDTRTRDDYEEEMRETMELTRLVRYSLTAPRLCSAS
jgi:hypothetical protein